MASRFCFLALPDEVRDRIYHHYTIARGGYVYNPKTNKLRTADDGPIDISLMYTCRQAASEMDCLALNTNTITFYPDYSEESLPFAYFHGMKLLQVHHLKCQMFRGARWCFTKRLKTIFRNAYPELKSIFADLNTTLRFENMGYPLLDVYDAINQALYLSCFHHNFANVVRAAKNTWGHRTKPDFDDIISSPINPWDVTTPTDIDHTEFNEFHSSLPQSVQVTKYGFSAAALAVKFLGSIQTKTFSEIRNVVLEEDHPAVAMAASHARGLIPFCQRNPFLKIERRAHLWKNIFLQGVLPRACKYVPVCPPMRSIEVLDTHLSESLTRSVALWTVEALSLVPAGMPADQFSLVLHGDMMPGKCSEIFQNVIMRDAAWQAAIEENVERGLLKPLDFFHRPCGTFPFDTFKDFPQALDDITHKRTSIVRCDFEIGEYSVSDAKKLAEDRHEWSLEMWRLQWLEIGLANWNDTPTLLKKLPLLKSLVPES